MKIFMEKICTTSTTLSNKDDEISKITSQGQDYILVSPLSSKQLLVPWDSLRSPRPSVAARSVALLLL